MKSLSYVALLRGINVGGHAIISMQDLKKAFVSLGFANIKTVLASGNVLFEAAEENRTLLTRKIEQKLQSELGVGIFVMIRTIEEIRALLESKPFKNTKISPQTKLHVSFLPLDLDHGLKVSERLPFTDFNVFRVSRSEVCSAVEISPNHGTTELMKELEKQFGKKITTRTWNTVERIGKALGTLQKSVDSMPRARLYDKPRKQSQASSRGRPHGGLRVALAQLALEEGNLEHNLHLANTAAEQGALEQVDFLNLPEAADWGWLHQQARMDALPIPGRYTEFLSKLARRYTIWISAGCLEKDGQSVYNSAVLIDRTGCIVLKHRKIDTLPWLTKHLYDCGRPEDIRIVDTEFGRIGLTICADNFNIQHPKRVAALGAWLLIAPHGFAAEPDKLKQNSLEYQNHICNVAKKTGLWVVGTDAVLGTVRGGAWSGRLHSGCSVVARPDGTPAIIAKFKQPDFVVFDIAPSIS